MTLDSIDTIKMEKGKIINNKTCAILAHGYSLEELEKRIDDFKHLDIVWCGMNYFSPSEGILKKINKEFTIVFDCSKTKDTIKYELKSRIPRLTEYLSRSVKNVYMTSRVLYSIRNQIGSDFNEKYKDKIIYVDELGFDAYQFRVSIHLYIITLFKLGVKNIVLFGADGGGGTRGSDAESYYRSHLAIADAVLGNSYPRVPERNNDDVNTTYGPLAEKILGYVPEVINCSTISKYTPFKKMSYDDTIKWLNDKR